MNKVFIFLATWLISYSGFTQVNGPTPVNVGSSQNYTFSNSTIYAEWYWEATGGTIVSENLVGTEYQVTVSWNTVSATNVIRFWKGTYHPLHGMIFTSFSKTVDVQVPTPNATINHTFNCGNTVITRTNSPTGSLYQWWWQTEASGTSTALGNGTSVTITTPQTLYLRSRLTNSPYTWSASSQSAGSITVQGAAALATGLADEVIYGQGSITIQANAQGGDQVKWYASATGGAPFFTGSAYTTPVLTESVKYYITSYNSTTACESAERTVITVTVAPLVSPFKIETESVRIPGITNEVQMASLTGTQQHKQVTYFDGAGRTMQQISVAATPLGYDVVQPVTYDAYGRTSTRYLPYVAAAATGALQQDVAMQQPLFYQAAGDKIADDTKPYTATLFESSPLGRVIETGNIGAGFQPGDGHSKLIAYTFNTASDNVRRFNADGSSTSFYAANKLYKTMLTDENGHQVITFTDGLGRTVLKKAQLDEAIQGVTTPWLETYYVYNDLGRNSYTIPPKGVVALHANGWLFTQSIKDQYVYEHVYDALGRLIENKTPGQARIYYGYNKADRLVLMQDGLLRSTNQWLFIKYDQKGRAIMQGLYTNASNVTREAVQLLIEAQALDPEKRGNKLEGYTNNSFPKTNKDGSPLKVLSVNYFDDYDFDNSGTADYSYAVQGLTGSSLQQATVTEAAQGSGYGRATGSKRLNVTTGTWLYTYVFYDKYGRVIQVRSDNHLLATREDLVTNLYDFEGKLVKREAYHKAGATAITTVSNQYTYDATGRLVKIYQSNNGATSQLLAQYQYNELGQLVDKKLHGTGTPGSETFLQSVDYRYTIRGQLQSINNAQLAIDNNNDDTDDYFGMELLYNQSEAGLNTTARYDGNISAIKWKGAGSASGNAGQKSYAYSYDKTGRLTEANYMKKETLWNKEAGAQNEAMTYDHNGNLLTLTRNHKNPATGIAQAVDNLTYTYNDSNGNSLLKVEDSATSAGFTNAASESEEYTYDVNGNLTADKNKGIDSIKYNFLGKPVRVKFSDGKVITYGYDAAGSKLTQKLYSGDTLKATTDYVNGFVYENGVLSFFGSPEGRVVNKGGTLEYQYAIADHQGNTRVVFSSVSTSATSTTDFENSTNNEFLNYPSGAGRSSLALFNHTPSGTYSQKLTGASNSQVGVAKSIKVYPGDKVKIEAYAKYYNPSGTTSNLTNFALALTGAFGVTSASTGEALKAYNTLNNYGGIIAGGGSGGSSDYPKLFVNILLFDKDFNFLDAAWEQIDGGEQVGVTPKAAHDYLSKEITVTEAGYAYIYVSNENPTLVEFYVDDVSITHTPTNVIQYNEYYPFGLQTNTSWTRDNHKNDYLYNAGSELNNNTQWYEMFYRGYDPAIGRMLQVDPYASSFASVTPYNYALNRPQQVNDPSGGYAYSPRGSGWGPRATIDFKLRAIMDLGMANIPYTWVSDLDNYANFYGSYDGGGAGGHGGSGRSGYSTSNQSEIVAILSAFNGGASFDDVYNALASGGGYVLMGGAHYGDTEESSYNYGEFVYIEGGDTTTPWQLGWEWLTGNRPKGSDRTFTNGDTFTEMLRQHDHVENTRRVIRDRLAFGGELQGNNPYNLGGIEGVGKYLKDYSTLLTAGKTGNLAVTFLGSYNLQYQVTAVEGNTAAILFTVSNPSTIASAFRPPVIGYYPWWTKNVAEPLNKFFSSGPMSQTTQTIIWTETIKWK